VGAHFGVTGGWERGLWYAQDKSENELPYSVGEQPWFDIAKREAAVMQDGVAMIDLTPFGKFDITGKDAQAVLQYLATINTEIAIGRAVYTPLLNKKGGIEADVTITRFSRDKFRITSGAATRTKDLGWLRRHAVGGDVMISDVTDSEVVIGVMGGGARELLKGLTGDNNETDWNDFPFSTSREISIAGVLCRATRLSFVGEMGWELNMSASQASPVFDAIHSAGANPLGHFALDGCRMEKGYKHWGHDLGPEITPLQAGLGFTIDWETDFLGKAALQAQVDTGMQKRILLFDVSGHPLILHDEPIVEGGRVVGLTTSGARGPRTLKTLALGMVDIAVGETLSESCQRNFEIEVAGNMYQATPLMQPPFDPQGKRMKA